MNDNQNILIKNNLTEEDIQQRQNEELMINTINDFVQFMMSIKTKKQLYEDELKQKDGSTNDFLHMIELCDLTDEESLELIKNEKHNRKDRRIIKDNLDMLTVIMEYIANPDMYKLIGDMSKLVGELRKIKKQHETRVYKKREEIFVNTPFKDIIENGCLEWGSE